jgi:hypothetical protein
MLREPYEERQRMRRKTHTDIKQKSGMGGLHIPDGKREHIPLPECYFVALYKEKTKVKIKLQQFLDLR